MADLLNEMSNQSATNTASGNPSEFVRMVDALTNHYAHVWWKLCGKPAAHEGAPANNTARRKRQKSTDQFVDCFIRTIESYPAEQSKAGQWKLEINRRIEGFVQKIGFIELDQSRFLLSSGILESTRSFINRAREFDGNFQFDDIWQAMRNVWIMNISQMLLGRPIACTPSVFAYSMLYPYTDNYIDSADFAIDCKQSYNSRFERRLSGEHIESQNDLEKKIFRLVELIEEEYDRSSFPDVFNSLVAIHRAQCKSIDQHKQCITPYTSDILGISFEKGGISVLADAYLVKGSLTPSEIDFFFGYGLMLQLCDDLQDVKEDSENNHHTIFSLTSKGWPLDTVTDALFHLVDYVSELVCHLDVENPLMFCELIRKNCRLLIYCSIAKNRKCYSSTYWNRIKAYIPYNRRYLMRSYQRVLKKFKRLKESYHGVATEDILYEALR